MTLHFAEIKASAWIELLLEFFLLVGELLSSSPALLIFQLA